MEDIMSLLGKNNTEKEAFRCPMKCEGEKTYDSPGNCPVCNMKLVQVQEENMIAHHHHCC